MSIIFEKCGSAEMREHNKLHILHQLTPSGLTIHQFNVLALLSVFCIVYIIKFIDGYHLEFKVKEIAGDELLHQAAPQLPICRVKFTHNLLRIQFVLKYYNKYYSKYYNKLQLIKFTTVKVTLQTSSVASYFKYVISFTGL